MSDLLEHGVVLLGVRIDALSLVALIIAVAVPLVFGIFVFSVVPREPHLGRRFIYIFWARARMRALRESEEEHHRLEKDIERTVAELERFRDIDRAKSLHQLP